MRFTIISVLFSASAGMVSALSSEGALVAPITAAPLSNESETSNCVGSLLCCGSLTTSLDHIVDPILEDLGIAASAIVGSVGLLCDPYEASTCTSAPQCCTEANLLVPSVTTFTHING
ncbi:uncharacterized protein N7503_004304 [Penicillium pulvis]|uniref:uncharacterized protein n=1 Tax=Penicillium pulvis TaxID=1562058 RepID=UPI0025482FE8|nr:uncharacterized protein N7503_004304 [Penicillium pulvis]KAJ5801854.1 hypothetical protein N7503_004304 [Penicillium pulvis]